MMKMIQVWNIIDQIKMYQWKRWCNNNGCMFVKVLQMEIILIREKYMTKNVVIPKQIPSKKV